MREDFLLAEGTTDLTRCKFCSRRKEIPRGMHTCGWESRERAFALCHTIIKLARAPLTLSYIHVLQCFGTLRTSFLSSGSVPVPVVMGA